MKKSLHLQNFPDVSSLKNEDELVCDMDMVRAICSAALFIRDQRNLRVRLPLANLNIIGKNAPRMQDFKDIIADEVNVKNIQITPEIGDLAQIKLQINFKKVGAKLGQKMKEVNLAAREDNWQKIAENKIEIAGEILQEDEFEIKLISKNPENSAALPSNDCLVVLDINPTKELQEEGLARDVVRTIQQNRKDANLDISDHIKIAICSKDSQILQAVSNFNSYICSQTLAKEILADQKLSNDYQFNFDNKIEGFDVKIAFSVFR